MIHILVVEDEKAISELLSVSLSDAGYSCTCVYDGLSACDRMEEQSFDLMLLDIMLPELDGYEVLEYAKTLNLPVIFLTAKASLMDRVKGLELGAEDYIVKPFEIVELLARVKVVLRRYKRIEEHFLVYGDIQIDTENRVVVRDNEEVELTPKEFDILVLFMQNQNITLFRDRLYEQVWGGTYNGDSRTLDLHVQRLRKKLKLEDSLKTIYRYGYRLESKESQEA